MKIEIEISEDDAACLWANATWAGRTPHTVRDILTAKAAEMAEEFRSAFPHEATRAVDAFRSGGSPYSKSPDAGEKEKAIVRQFGEVWVATQDGMAAIGATRKDALAGLADCIKCKTSLQVIHTWATFQGGRELVPKHVENLTTEALAPFRLPSAQAD